MKKLSFQFIFTLLICFAFCSFAFSQEKPVAVKYDEYSEKNGVNLKLLDEKIKRFVKQLRRLPKTTKGMILYFSEIWEVDCFSDEKSSAEKREEFTKNLLLQKYKIASPQIVIKHSGRYRNNTKIEFWFVPQNASDPESPGTFVDCFYPTLEAKGIEVVSDKNKPLIFTANISGMATPLGLAFTWEISDGEIIEGKESPILKVDISKVKAKEITATFKIKGLDKGIGELCTNSASFTTRVTQSN